jgi:hypothetical protein
MEDARRPADLDAVHAALWQELTRAPHDKHHEWRTPVLATVDGEMADARTVVLREADSNAQTLLIFSDARAGKLAQLQSRPLGMLVLWSRRLSWQLRLRVRLTAQTDGLAVASRWARLRLTPAAQDYLSPVTPGLPCTPPADGSAGPPASERGHFALLQAQVLSSDWLELHRAGHRRARFDEAGARWLAP